ncbi:MAG: ABC transporter permease, partial [Limisphaerales bacterium]
MNDLKFAFRQLLKHPGFSAAAVLTLALGIGVNLALLTLLYDQFLRPKGLPQPETLWQIMPADATGRPKFFNLSRPYYEALRQNPRAFRAVIGMRAVPVKVRTPEGWASTVAQLVSGDYFTMIGVSPDLGRGFRPEEDQQPGTHSVAVISHGFWQDHFQGDPEILGKTLSFKGEYPETRIVEIVGVMAPGFVGLSATPRDVILPLSMETLLTVPSSYSVFGRLDRNIPPWVAAEVLAPIVEEVTRTLHPPSPPEHFGSLANNNAQFTRVALLPAGHGNRNQAFVQEYGSEFLMHTGVASGGSLLVLLIAALNLTTLLLARGLSRRRELATRLALGASRWAVVRPLLIEGVLLATLGAASALVMQDWFTAAAPKLMSLAIFDPSTPVSLRHDLRVVAAALIGALVVGVAFSVWPAFVVTRFELIPALKCSPSGPERDGLWSPGRFLVVGQVAASLVLLASAGLCFRALAAQLRGGTGFATGRLIVANADFEGVLSMDSRFIESGSRRLNVDFLKSNAPTMAEELRQRLVALPGVEAVGVMGGAPLSAPYRVQVTSRLAGHEGREVSFGAGIIGAGCFQALGIPLVEGREVNPADLASPRRVALVNESFVHQFWPGGSVLGRELVDERWNEGYEVIGVVRDARLESTAEPPQPTAFFGSWASALHPTFIVRTRAAPGSLLGTVTTELVKTDPWFRQSRVQPLREVLEARFATERNILRLLEARGALALGLTILGAYGLMSYRATWRTREIGIRLAVGATPVAVGRLMVDSGVRLGLAGVVLGLPAALGAAWILRRFFAG